jgi:hypothetical protein
MEDRLIFQERFAITKLLPGRAGFEVLAMSAGVGNGWEFEPVVLEESLALWEGVECFIDHAPITGCRHDLKHRSIKDLAGICESPTWDKEAKGVRLTLRSVGPAAGVLEEIGKEVIGTLENGKAAPNVGFSADVIFEAEGKKVIKIKKVLSLDLVYSPARGGKFIRSLNQNMEVELDEENEDIEDALQVQLQAQKESAEEMAKQTIAAQKVRAEMCGYLLDSALAASRLPQAMNERIRTQFAGKVFEAPELTAAIEDGRKLVTELSGANTVQGMRVQMFDSRDQLQVAVDDLLGAQRDEATKSMKVHKLQGIRELYMMLTGDYDLHGGYNRERVQLATTADFTGLVKNALNKIVVNTWDQLGKAGYNWWEKIVRVEHFNTVNTITGTLVGTVGTLPTVAEGAEYTELAVGDSPETGTFYKYGGYIPLTLELIDRDESRKLAAYPRELAAAGLRKISSLVAAIFTANSNVGPTMKDTGALFNATAVTTAAGHKNLLTTALSSGEWDVVSTAVFKQPMLIKNETGLIGTGPAMGINPRYLAVPRKLQLTAMKILYPSLENTTYIYSENQQRGQPGDVVVVPEWTDETDWAAICDPLIAPAIYVGERFGLMPEVFISGDSLSPAVFMNDEHRMKVRHFLACWVNDYRPLHKSNVAA